jgi:hypothetical protein
MGRKRIFLTGEENYNHIANQQEKYRIEHRDEIILKRVAKSSLSDTINKLEKYIISLIEWNNDIKNAKNQILVDKEVINKIIGLAALMDMIYGQTTENIFDSKGGHGIEGVNLKLLTKINVDTGLETRGDGVDDVNNKLTGEK